MKKKSEKLPELRACPFCGHRAKMVKSSDALWDTWPYYIYCSWTRCLVSPATTSFRTAEQAVKAWNANK